MKKLIVAALVIAGLVRGAYADEGGSAQIDDTFTKAKTWLSEQNLTLVGSRNENSDEAALLKDAVLFYGEAVGNPDHRTPAQRELMAKRAAVVLAQRAAAEYLEGCALVGSTSVKDVMAQNDDVRTAVAAFIKGTHVVFQEYSKDKDMAIAIIKIGVHGPKGFASAIYEKMNTDPKLKKEIATNKHDFKAKPEKLDEVYDGLIIDATEQNFRPALINRIFAAKGDVLYDPAKVSQKVLVEQGCGEYTNNVDKAKAALEIRGVKNPLTVIASGATNASDLQVSEEDAVKIFSANQKSKFLAGAKVAFVLK
jgi:hypothetical protein